jgi:SAM-dependent methyltransferase
MRQKSIYDAAYRGPQRVRRLLRFDIRHRCRRLHEVLAGLQLDVSESQVLDVGVGNGDLLASFPTGCCVWGAEISGSAVASASGDARFYRFRAARFSLVQEDTPDDLPPGPFDVIVSSHVLEHVADDRRWVQALRERLNPGGIALVFVPIEEPGYNPDHVRVYSLRSIANLVEQCGLEVLHREGSMHLNGHLWKLVTIPSRRRWPGLGPLVNTLRLAVLSAIPYRATRMLERRLERIGVGPRQAFVVARSPETTGMAPVAEANDCA